jgi:hypothetical protein
MTLRFIAIFSLLGLTTTCGDQPIDDTGAESA